MPLSSELISQFVKITNDDKDTKKESTVYGTTAVKNGTTYVKLDGSDLLTPINTTADVQPGERVIVMIKNHSATITGNMTSPAARVTEVRTIKSDVDDVSEVASNKLSASDIEGKYANIDFSNIGKAAIDKFFSILGYKPYFSKGDSTKVQVRLAGYVTNDGKDLHFEIPLCKPIIGSPTISVTSADGFIIRQNDGYRFGSSTNTRVHPNSILEIYYIHGFGLHVCVRFSKDTDIIDNDTIGIDASLNISFI